MARKIVKSTCVLVLILLIAMGTATAANRDEIMTRGQFAELLVAVSNLKGDLPAAELLVEKGIMVGYPDGQIYIDRGITQVEAVTLAAKALGLEDGVMAPDTPVESLPQRHWGYNYYGWLARQGLTSGAPREVFTISEGENFLDKVFSSDPAAVEILEKAQIQAQKQEKVHMVIDGRVKMIPRPEVEGVEEIPGMEMEMRIVQNAIFPDKIHQLSTFTMPAPGGGLEEITTETYIIEGKIFQQMPDPETGQIQWLRYPDLPGLEEILKQSTQKQSEVIPAGMEKYLHYQLLDKVKIHGEEAYVLSFYGRVDDLGQFMEDALGQFGDALPTTEALGPVVEMIKSMSYWGIQYVGVETLLPLAADFSTIVAYAEEFLGEPMPIKAAQMSMEIKEYDYDEGLEIIVPKEALEAPELSLDTPSREVEPISS